MRELIQNIKNKFSPIAKTLREAVSRNKRIIIPISIGIVAILIGLTNTTHADGALSWLEVSVTSAVGQILFFFTWIITWILGIVIGLETWLIGIILNLSIDIVNAPAIQIGFPITLSIANMGFVIALIVIAINTILGNNDYNAKAILFKLVSAAILVNFSLVIVGSLLRASDTITTVFINQISPSKNGGLTNFTDNIASAFQPQQKFLGKGSVSSTDLTAGANIFNSLGELTKGYAGLMIGAISLTGIVITLGVLVGMLVVRYVTIMFLVIIMPFAWLASIFKEYSQHWNKWWSLFSKQLTFAPIMTFTLYLGIQTALHLGEFIKPDPTIPNSFGAAFDATVSSAMSSVVGMLTVSGIMLGGVWVAQTLGVQFAGAAGKAIGTVKNKVTGALLTRPGGAVGRALKTTAQRGARGAAITAGTSGVAKSTAGTLQKLGAGFDVTKGNAFTRGLKRTSNAITGAIGARKGLEIVGSSIETKTKELGETQKKSYAEERKGRSINASLANINSGNLKGTEFVEHIKTIKAAGKLGEVKNLEELLAKNREAFAQVGEQALHQQLGGFEYKEIKNDKGKVIGKEDHVSGNYALLGETKINEAKKAYEEQKLSDFQLAALINDEKSREKLNNDQIIAILEILDKKDSSGLIAKNIASIIEQITSEKDATGKVKRDETTKKAIEKADYNYINAEGNVAQGNYLTAYGRDKSIDKIKTATGQKTIEAREAVEQAEKLADGPEKVKIVEEAQKKENVAVKATLEQNAKSLASLINNNIGIIDAGEKSTAEDKERASIVLSQLYSNLNTVSSDKMNKLIKELGEIPDGINKFEQSLINAQQEDSKLRRKDNKPIPVEINLHQSVHTSEEKRNLFSGLGFSIKNVIKPKTQDFANLPLTTNTEKAKGTPEGVETNST